MRGTRRGGWMSVGSVGIIPAYAGNTDSRPARPAFDGDHPRVCGEHADFLQCLHDFPGSSPRMRGTPIPSGKILSGAGIIPAYAGNTARALPRAWVARDHPRVCGEHVRIWSIMRMAWGSSPRMRGTLDNPQAQNLIIGIIPAYAGNTNCGSGLQLGSRDHPRVCGEHGHCAHAAGHETGSSPRMRGTRSTV